MFQVVTSNLVTDLIARSDATRDAYQHRQEVLDALNKRLATLFANVGYNASDVLKAFIEDLSDEERSLLAGGYLPGAQVVLRALRADHLA